MQLAVAHPRERGAAAERERAAIEQLAAAPERLHVPRGIKLRGARRPLRVRPEDVAAEPIDGGLDLRFSLPPGSYATVLLEELLATPCGRGPE